MQTQCPHCDTRFRVTESQINTADGFVRCSVCKEVFNAFEVAELHDHQQSLLSTENAGNKFDLSEPEHTGNNDNTEDVTETETVDFNETSATRRRPTSASSK